MQRWDDYNQFLLALVMWREARGEGPEGMKAVGCVVRNRVGTSEAWSVVITAKWQFSSMTAPGDAMLVQWPVYNDPAFLEAMTLAFGIYNGVIVDNTNGATHYRNPATATSKSFQAEVDSGRLKQVATIGHHVFYK